MEKKSKKILKRNLTWPQAKVRFPNLKPYGDADGDGVKNFLDCRPFDRKRQDELYGEEIAIGFGHIKNLKTIGDVQELEKRILSKKTREKD